MDPEQIAWIVNHAEDRFLTFGRTFLPIIEGIAAHCPKVKGWIAMCDRAHMPAASKVANLLCYEDLPGGKPTIFDWPQIDQRSAVALFYTLGKTGKPKGAL